MAPSAAIDSLMITPISFQKLPAEDGDSIRQRQRQQQFDQRVQREASKRGSPDDNNSSSSSSNNNKRQDASLSNFSMRPSYPAVTFDRVCFSVSKSQQRANFLGDCLGRAKQCLSLGLAGRAHDNKAVDILKSINLNVPTGCIFGLLGPSSCGKTTLLRCLVGLLKPSSGSIGLFCQETRNFGPAEESEKDECTAGGCCCCCRCAADREQSANLSKVPGANVGYMPQDLGLYEDFTIRQLLTMFGRYMGMESSLIKSRIAFMREFLDLPDADRQIMSLSGGQKRRVSFAIACLHMPPLIILDEPTVGVDPLLRQSIWKYLRRLADEENRTIIITTHYIEEAAQADQVALMRAGEILIQETPKRIMQSNGCKTLEEAFLKICSKAERDLTTREQQQQQSAAGKQLRPQLKFDWNDKIKCELNELMERSARQAAAQPDCERQQGDEHLELATATTTSDATDSIVRRLQERAREKLAIFEYLQAKRAAGQQLNEQGADRDQWTAGPFSNVISELDRRGDFCGPVNPLKPLDAGQLAACEAEAKKTSIRCLKRSKLVISKSPASTASAQQATNQASSNCDESFAAAAHQIITKDRAARKSPTNFRERMRKKSVLLWALLYKNYRRNVNSLPLLAFQFLLPMIQMISFSLCIGGRPTSIGLGLVNLDQPVVSFESAEPTGSGLLALLGSNATTSSAVSEDESSLWSNDTELLSARYLSFLDTKMLAVRPYESLADALADVRRGKLWAALEIGPNFTRSLASRFDLENFYQLEAQTIRQSVIKIYPDRSNKILDMVCTRSLVNSYRQFLTDEFEHFKRLPIEVKEPIFDIKPNLISNSMDGYTESIAAGLLASLTYIMAAGLTCFIMVVERSAGILERTYTSGISPLAYLLAHAAFRSFVMMLQIGLVLFLTFYLLEQPLVGSIWLAYLMLMTLNMTGISYGLLISSLVKDQNGAALTIVSSLVCKITMSGILWPFEAIPRWLRWACYMQPLALPVQALKNITLKGTGLEDKSVYLGFVVSLSWLVLFLAIAAKRFKFYQH